MNIQSSVTAIPASPLFLPFPSRNPADGVLAAARRLFAVLEQGAKIDASTLRNAMEDAFGASDNSGAWDWKLAYEACEAATVLFSQKYGASLFRKTGSPAARIAALGKLAALLPTHTRRSEDSQRLQQFSTPIPLGLAAVTASAVTSFDVVLEPSAAPAFLQPLPACPAAGSSSTNMPGRAQTCCSSSSRAKLSRALMRLRSTIISIWRSSRPSS